MIYIDKRCYNLSNLKTLKAVMRKSSCSFTLQRIGVGESPVSKLYMKFSSELQAEQKSRLSRQSLLLSREGHDSAFKEGFV